MFYPWSCHLSRNCLYTSITVMIIFFRLSLNIIMWAAGGTEPTTLDSLGQFIEWLTPVTITSSVSSCEYGSLLFPVSDYRFFQNHYV